MFRKKSKEDELELLAEKERALREQMSRLETYIQGGAEQERADYINTMPAPDELDEKRRHVAFVDQVMSKKEIRNIKRNQAKSTGLFILLAIMIACISSWIIRACTDYISSL